jgi:paraquat-inducible protein B
VSGLRTIVLGNYITVQPGNGAPTNIFIGAEKEPIEPIKALDILLLAPKLDSLQPQSPVFYRAFRLAKCWIAVSATTPAKSHPGPHSIKITLRWCG